MCHSASSQLWVSLGMSFTGQDILMPYLTQVRCQVSQKTQGFKFVPVALVPSHPCVMWTWLASVSLYLQQLQAP